MQIDFTIHKVLSSVKIPPQKLHENDIKNDFYANWTQTFFAFCFALIRIFFNVISERGVHHRVHSIRG